MLSGSGSCFGVTSLARKYWEAFLPVVWQHVHCRYTVTHTHWHPEEPLGSNIVPTSVSTRFSFGSTERRRSFSNVHAARQVSLVTAAEAVQARDPGAVLGGAAARAAWQRTAPAPPTSPSLLSQTPAAAHASGPVSAAGHGGAAVSRGAYGGELEPSCRGEAGKASGDLPGGIAPQPQLQGLAEAGRVALQHQAEEEARKPSLRRPKETQPDPAKAPGGWPFDEDSPGVTVLEMTVGSDVAAVAVHQPPQEAVQQDVRERLYDVLGAFEEKPREGWARDWEGAESGSGARGVGAARPRRSSGGGGVVDKGSTMVPLFGPVVEGRMKLYVGGRLAAGVEGRHVYDVTGEHCGALHGLGACTRCVCVAWLGCTPGCRGASVWAIHA